MKIRKKDEASIDSHENVINIFLFGEERNVTLDAIELLAIKECLQYWEVIESSVTERINKKEVSRMHTWLYHTITIWLSLKNSLIDYFSLLYTSDV